MWEKLVKVMRYKIAPDLHGNKFSLYQNQEFDKPGAVHRCFCLLNQQCKYKLNNF